MAVIVRAKDFISILHEWLWTLRASFAGTCEALIRKRRHDCSPVPIGKQETQADAQGLG
jgi:hypothetical protein